VETAEIQSASKFSMFLAAETYPAGDVNQTNVRPYELAGIHR
jgi:hypothetical protein